MKRKKIKQIHISAKLQTKKKKKQKQRKLGDYINSICEFTRPYERYYSLVIEWTSQT